MVDRPKTKWVYGWLVPDPFNPPRLTVDLFFSSEDAFKEAHPHPWSQNERLIFVEVEESFDTLDFIPDNY